MELVRRLTVDTSDPIGLKEELFALEQDKISGRVAAEEYLQTKAGLEAILKRALNSPSR